MRWFKHLTDASDDESLVAIEQQFGLVGYARWWKLLEVIGKQMRKPSDPPSLTYPWAKWESILVAKRKLLASYLLASANLGLINFEANGELITISIPKLLKYRDEYTKKSGHTPKLTPDNVRVQRTENREQRTEEALSSEAKSLRTAPKKHFDAKEIEYELSALLFAKIQERNPGHRAPNLQKWALHVDRMIRLDGRDPADIRRLIEWSQADDFWQNNILCTESLREQFDKLFHKSKGRANAHADRERPEGSQGVEL